MKKTSTASIALVAGVAEASPLAAQELVIESWRNDDITIWRQIIIPTVNAAHPEIAVRFQPTAPAYYNAALNAERDGGAAGDLITCRPFDASLQLFSHGHLVALTDLEELGSRPETATAAWSTDGGAATFCMPMASVIHGFMYNKDVFVELGLEVPKTAEEFFAVLDALEAEGSYLPMAMGTADQWEAATMGYATIGPTYWRGQEGRLALIAGEAKLTDLAYVAPYHTLAGSADYLPSGFEAQSYPDSQNHFTLGRAAIYPIGFWEISPFQRDSFFEMGAFEPPVANADDPCFFSDHVDISSGINAASANQEDARTFLQWAGSAEFAELCSNARPGFFSFSTLEISLEDPIAQEFIDWRQECSSSIRIAHQMLSRRTPNLWNDMWVMSANVINGVTSPEEATERLQSGLASWYEPHRCLHQP